VIIDLIVHLTIGLNWVTQIMGLLSIPVKLRWYQYMSNTGNGPSCPPMSKVAWSLLSTLEKLGSTSCPPWHNWMVPVVHLSRKWHGTSCPWYQLSGSPIFQYKLKRCTNKECCKQCRHVMFKGIMTKWSVQKLAQETTQKLLQHHDATDI